MASGPITSWEIDGETVEIDGETVETVTDFIFWGSKITAEGDGSQEIKMLAPWKKSYDKHRQHIKKQRRYFANKGPSSQSYGFSSSHVRTWDLDYKTSWVLKNWCFWAVMLEKTLESPLDCKATKLGNPKGNQSWIFIERTDAEAETPILWPPDAKSRLIGKDPDAERDWGQEKKGTTKDEMIGWHHQIKDMSLNNSGSGWWTGKPGVLQSMRSQRVGRDWATELNWLLITCKRPQAIIIT